MRRTDFSSTSLRSTSLRTGRYVAVLGLALGAVSAVPAQQLAPDVILSNGKIITVDERFSVAQAVAIRGDRIVAVGSDAEVAKLASPATRRIDLRGRAVIPGLIDNHMHLTRAGTTWQWEVRWDGIGSRAAALEKLRARAKTVAAGEWISIQAGRLADLVVLDRDYLTIPADQIKDIQPVMTMVGGRIVYETKP